MSLRVIIDNKQVALGNDMEIVINLKNAKFNEREEDATYPLSVDLSSNRDVFGLLDRLHTGNLEEEYPATVYFGPYKLLEGRCVMTDVADGDVELFITTDKNTFFGRARDIYLDALDLGREQHVSKSAMLDAFTDSALKGNKDYVVCPLLDPYLPNLGVEQAYDFYNYFYPDESRNPSTKYTEQVSGKYCIFVPFTRLYKLIEKVINGLGYDLLKNDLLLDDNFKDVILVCRRNGMYKDSLGSSFSYNMHVPRILVSDFVAEIERKFGVVFIVNENNRSVEIRGLNDGIVNVEVFDNMSKHAVEKEDRKTGIIFKDKGLADKMIERYAGKLNVEYGDTKDAETIECISTVVGVEMTELGSRTEDGSGTSISYFRHAATRMTYTDNTAYMNQIDTEFRLSVYRGYIKEEDSLGVTSWFPVKYPYSDPLPVDYAPNKYTLMWKDGLFNKYHKENYDLLFSIKESHEFNLKPDMVQLGKLQQIFANKVVIRNRPYRCYEQEIVISKTSVTSHVIRCYPV